MAFNKSILLSIVLNITLCYSHQTENDLNITNTSIIGKDSNMSYSSHSDCDDDEPKYGKLPKFKLTYLGEFLMEPKNFDIFEQESMPS